MGCHDLKGPMLHFQSCKLSSAFMYSARLSRLCKNGDGQQYCRSEKRLDVMLCSYGGKALRRYKCMSLLATNYCQSWRWWTTLQTLQRTNTSLSNCYHFLVAGSHHGHLQQRFILKGDRTVAFDSKHPEYDLSKFVPLQCRAGTLVLLHVSVQYCFSPSCLQRRCSIDYLQILCGLLLLIDMVTWCQYLNRAWGASVTIKLQFLLFF